MSKYDALGEFLRAQAQNEIPLTFDRIEKITGTKLPASAIRHRPWWSNNPQNSVMTKVWLDAGFESEQVDMEGRKLVFRRKEVARTNDGSSDVPGPTGSQHHPLYGWLKDTVRVAPGVDLTEPADPEWANRIAP